MTPDSKPSVANNDDRTPPSIRAIQTTMNDLLDEVKTAMVDMDRVLELVATCIITEGAHILFEDVPGVGKSVMAESVAAASGSKFRRIQFTPDMLPADITGTYMLDQKTNEFEFQPGPIFTNFLLADEINRASPKTQSALLEAMAEKQVSVEGQTHQLAEPFIVMATQNPIEQEGTYPLPEAQLSRFMIKTSIGNPDRDGEREILRRRQQRKTDEFDISAVTDAETLAKLKRAAENVKVHPKMVNYISELTLQTRKHEDVKSGSSPRGSLALMKLGKSQAALRGRPYIVPDDVKELAVPVLHHRLQLQSEAEISGVTEKSVVREVLDDVPVPKPKAVAAQHQRP
jgi:MoxR-like ATPase